MCHTCNNHTEPNGVGGLSFTPMLAPNAVFLTTFLLLFCAQAALTVKWWRYYGYAMGMLSGCLLELLGYVAKVQLAHDRLHKDAYILYIIGLTLGPTFLSSSLYLSVSTLLRDHPEIRVMGMGPKLYATVFILGDFMCLCFIGVGGSLAAIYASLPIGVDLMIAGLATQVLFTGIFCAMGAAIYSKMQSSLVVHGGDSRWFTLTAMATACLFVRSCWRVAELSGGFNGKLASKEGLFIALDSVPMVIMSIILTVLHPGLSLLRRGSPPYALGDMIFSGGGAEKLRPGFGRLVAFWPRIFKQGANHVDVKDRLAARLGA